MKWVRIEFPCLVAGEPRELGSVIQVSDSDARLLFNLQLAKPAHPPVPTIKQRPPKSPSAK